MQDRREIDLDRIHKMQQRPGRTPCLIKDIVDREPRGFILQFANFGSGLVRRQIPDRIGIEVVYPDARAQPMRQVAETLGHQVQPGAQIIDSNEEPGVAATRVLEPRQVLF